MARWILLIAAVILSEAAEGQDQIEVTRVVVRLNSPEQVLKVDRGRRINLTPLDYSVHDLYTDRLNDGARVLISYNFYRISDSEPMALVKIRVQFPDSDRSNFLLVGERL